MTEVISCPSCGKKAMVEVDDKTRKKHFDCPDCTCRFSLVFNRDKIIEEMQICHMLAEDYPG